MIVLERTGKELVMVGGGIDPEEKENYLQAYYLGPKEWGVN